MLLQEIGLRTAGWPLPPPATAVFEMPISEGCRAATCSVKYRQARRREILERRVARCVCRAEKNSSSRPAKAAIRKQQQGPANRPRMFDRIAAVPDRLQTQAKLQADCQQQRANATTDRVARSAATGKQRAVVRSQPKAITEQQPTHRAAPMNRGAW